VKVTSRSAGRGILGDLGRLAEDEVQHAQQAGIGKGLDELGGPGRRLLRRLEMIEQRQRAAHCPAHADTQVCSSFVSRFQKIKLAHKLTGCLAADLL